MINRPAESGVTQPANRVFVNAEVHTLADPDSAADVADSDRAGRHANAVHLATAVVHDDCGVLYTGDPNLKEVDEIETAAL